MKILHTSDWHLGNKFFGYDRDDEFKLVLDFIIDTIKKEKIDCLLIAGDVFDIYYPPQNALKMYYNFLIKAKEFLKHIFIIAGNHDSISTLSAPKEILNALDIKVISGEEDIDEMIVTIDDIDFLLVPFLREVLLRERYKSEDLKENIKRFYEEILNKSKNKKILTGHLTVTNSTLSGSERDIYIGKIDAISYEVFKDADYVVLGHLHRYQRVKPNIVYSGSILKMSFDENNDKKLVVIDSEDFSTKTIDIPVFREIVSLEGSKDEIFTKLQKINASSKLKAFVELKFNEEIGSDINDFRLENIEIVKYSSLINKKEFKKREIKSVNILNIFEEIFKEYDNFEELKKEFLDILEKAQSED